MIHTITSHWQKQLAGLNTNNYGLLSVDKQGGRSKQPDNSSDNKLQNRKTLTWNRFQLQVPFFRHTAFDTEKAIEVTRYIYTDRRRSYK